MDIQAQSTLKKSIILITIVGLSAVVTVIGTRFWLRAQSSKIPSGYSAVSYIGALERADRNNDGYINGLDYAYVVKRIGTDRMIADPQFGDKHNTLELSFQIANFNSNVKAIKTSLLLDAKVAKDYSEGVVVANEKTLPVPAWVGDDERYNLINPVPIRRGIVLPIQPPITSSNLIAKSTSETNVLGEEVESPDTRSGGEGTGSRGADSGRTIIPSVLGTVSSYTGSSGFDYPFSVPSGPGGLAPSFSLNYSSGNVDDALPYDDKYVSKLDRDGNPVHTYYYQNEKSYTPYFAGYGFNLAGGGSIVRDTRQEKDVYSLKGDVHHRFILNLPSGLSAELKYNKNTGRWTTIPEGFVKVDQAEPNPEGLPMPGSDFKIVDGQQWVVTASDGSKYFFGEEKLSDKISNEGGIHGSTPVTVPSHRTVRGEKIPYDAVHHTITNNGGIYNEFDIADICVGDSISDPCRKRISNDKPALLVTKWLLRKMETSDGRTIDYVYDSYQKYYGQYYKKDWGNKLSYATVDSFLRKVSWNDDKHRILFYREARTDMGGGQFLSMHRLSRVDVETKTESDNAFHLVRRYQLSYATDDTVMVADGGRNEWKASILSSIQEFGTNGETATPKVTLKYKQYPFNDGPSGSTIYLDTIVNGYGGETQYIYQPLAFALINGSGKISSGPRRVRVVEKRVTDKTVSPPKTSREVYGYKDPNGNETIVGYADRIRGKEVSGREFLGHRWVDVKLYDFNSDKVLSHTRTEFYQFKGVWDENRIVKSQCENGQCKEEKVPGFTCFEPHLNKGRPRLQIVYNQLKGGGEFEAKSTHSTYNYRLLDWNAAGEGVIKEDNLDADLKECQGEGMAQPYFVYPKFSVVTVTEEGNPDFEKKGQLVHLKATPVNTRTIKSENLQYDLFGNLLKSVSYGPVDDKHADIDPGDNRYAYGYYLTGNTNWLNNLSYLSYSSNKANCGESDFECQFGRTETWYDQFTTDFTKVDIATQKPTLGFVSQTKGFIETDGDQNGTHNDPIVTFQGNEYLRLTNNPGDERRGGITKVYGPKSNVKSIDIENISKQIILQSQTFYDDYYKTLITRTENSQGTKTKFEDYDFMLQTPRKSLTQMEKGAEKYAVSKVEFDALGRVVASFAPDPADPSKPYSLPQSVNAYFDPSNDTSGLINRQMSLVSQTSDGKKHYVATDSFYNGLGQVKQTQVLSKKVGKELKRLVSDAELNAAGQQLAQYDPQVVDPITLPEISASNYKNIIREVAPQLASIEHKVVSRSVFDDLGRPIESTIVNSDTGETLTTTTAYYVNAQKATNPKGVVTIATSDTLGRPIDALVIDPVGDQHSIVHNEYAKQMVDKATKTTYISLKELQGGSKAETYVTYDKSGRLLTSDEPSLGKSEFQYDVLGHIINTKRVDREDVGSEYDDLGRLIATTYYAENQELFKGILADSKDVEYEYDNGPNALGKLVSVKHHMGTDTFTYDSAGRQKVVTKTIRDKTYKTTNHFNELSQIVKVEYPDNHTYEIEFDNEGVTQKTKLNGQLLAASTLFDKYGHATESEFVLGARTYLARTPYDAMGRLTDIGFARKDIADATGTEVLVPYFYQKLHYDNKAQLKEINELTFKDQVETRIDYTYTYDSFARLTNADSSKFNAIYSYDPFGRLQSKKEKDLITYAYDDKFPFFAPKAITRPSDPIPTPTKRPGDPIGRPFVTPPIDLVPTEGAVPDVSQTPTRRPSQSPTPTITSPSPTKAQPTPTPAGCFFEPVTTIKERMSDGTLRPLTTEEAKEFFTINDKRKEKYDTDENNKEFWNPFTNGHFKACPDGGCSLEGKTLCCVDEKNELPGAYEVGKDKAYIDIKYFGSGSSKFEVVDKYCNNKDGSSGCPANNSEFGGLRDRDFPVTTIPHLEIGCNKKYEYGWIVVKNTALGSLLRKLFPAGRGFADEKAVQQNETSAISFKYDQIKGSMLEDDKQCYTYNTLNQLISMKVKKDRNQACANGEFVKTVDFFYDYSGTLVLQEDYKPGNDKPVKQTYYFGPFEDEYTSE